MGENLYTVKDVARIARVTVRTLHHYDDVGLLSPSARSSAGYRLYSRDDVLRLQHILVCREMGMPLEEIRRMLDAADFDRRATLAEHRRRLVERAQNTERMIRAVDAAIAAIDKPQGKEVDMSALFDGFDPADYQEETERRWGNTDAYKEAVRRTQRYTAEDWRRIKGEMDDLLDRFAKKHATGVPPTDPRVLDLAEEHRLHVDRWYYPCNREMHAALGEMYVSDPRFASAFEAHGDGLSGYVSGAIRANGARKRK